MEADQRLIRGEAARLQVFVVFVSISFSIKKL